MNKTLLVTGAAGFIGRHVTQALLVRGDTVVGLDNLNDYYDPARKSANLAQMQSLRSRQASLRGIAIAKVAFHRKAKT